jgi:hypothetical protein
MGSRGDNTMENIKDVPIWLLVMALLGTILLAWHAIDRLVRITVGSARLDFDGPDPIPSRSDPPAGNGPAPEPAGHPRPSADERALHSPLPSLDCDQSRCPSPKI